MADNQYQFKVIDITGKIAVGTMEGKSKERVAELLKQQGYFIIAPIHPVKKRARLFTRPEKKLDQLTLAIFAKKLSDLLRGGVSLMAALKVLGVEGSKQDLRTGVKDILACLNRGETFSKSIKDTSLFPQFFLQTVEIGEVSGSLPESLAILAKYYHGQYRIHQKIRKALIYPTFLMAGIMLVLLAFFLVVLPETNKFLMEQGKELPLFTKILLTVASKGFLLLIALTLSFLLLIFQGLSLTPWGKSVINQMYWKTPILFRLYQTIQYHSLCKGLGFMLENGITLTGALNNSRRVITDLALRERLNQVESMVSQGFTLAESLHGAKLFALTERELVRVGEESGQLGEIFHYLAGYYEEKLEDNLAKLTSYIEPVLILVMTVVVAVVAGGILLPLYDLTGINLQ
ncbi:MAG: type II secretion system F family protein [Clostridia bacterium]|nr:type II secretion system F family protein [Clostridia bacterium]